MKKTSHYLQLLAVVLLISGVFFVVPFLRHTSSINETISTKVLGVTAETLSQSDYQRMSERYAKIVLTQDPKAALDTLAQDLSANPELIDSCHALTHDIGHSAYQKYQDFAKALDYQDDICGSGYLHGVIESYFQSSKSLFQSMQTVCTVYANLTTAGKCYHGVGHGLMYYTNNDLPLSITLCNSYPSTQQRIHCSEGVFMENFNSEVRFHPSRYLKASDPFYPCANQTTFYKDSCYFYAPDYYLHLHYKDYTGAVTWCGTAESWFISKCLNGVGSRVMKQNLDNPKMVESVCLSAIDPLKVSSCIDGMVSYFLVNYFSLSKAQDLCQSLQSQNRITCFSAIQKRNTLFVE